MMDKEAIEETAKIVLQTHIMKEHETYSFTTK